MYIILSVVIVSYATTVNGSTYDGVILRMWLSIARNLVVVAYLVSTTVYYIIWAQATDIVAASLAKGSSSSSQKMKSAMDRMKAVTHESRNNCVFGLIVNTTFSIPYLLPFQTYMFAFGLYLIAGKSHIVYLYMEEKDPSAKSSGSKESEKKGSRVQDEGDEVSPPATEQRVPVQMISANLTSNSRGTAKIDIDDGADS
jgi:hypothetical protein